MLKKLFTIGCALLSIAALATHNRAGEITYTWITGFTYEFVITTYTKDSAPADRCELTIEFGDGSNAVLYRENGAVGTCPSPARMGQNLGNDIRKNVYRGTHTYQAPGYYTVSMQDLNRNGGIDNIPNSINIPFYISTTLLIDPSMGPNSSPVLTNPPIDNGCTFKKFIHNPSAFDSDGDSLYYSLINCKGLGGVNINETYDPLYVQDPVKIDSITGDFIWDTPQSIGQYNFAMLIQEYRQASNGNWQLMGTVTRDFQVDIDACSNNPPVIDPLGPFCVIAGTTLSFTVSATDPDNNTIHLTASGGPFETTPAANFQQPKTGVGSVSQNFTWNTACSLVRKQPYYAQFKVTDVPFNPIDPPLSDIASVEINIIAPKPENAKAETIIEGIRLTWDPEVCSKSTGYDIYRREGSYGYVWDTCETGVPSYTGYTFHASRNGINNTIYIDSLNMKRGVQYCYMIVAKFPDGSESIASDEVCAELPKDVPILTNVDVLSTDVSNGQILVKWIPPREIDSVAFPPPYGYTLERSDNVGGNTFSQIASFSNYDDTVFTDNGIDTESRGYNYRVSLISNNNLIAYSDPASSIYLSIFPLDKINYLTFDYNTPWTNDTIVVFRETSPGSNVFDSLGFSTNDQFLDTGLVNGDLYCYRARGMGRFSGSGLPHPLINHSQIACSSPLDTAKPCPPILDFEANCELGTLTLSWEDSVSLFCIPDIVEYNIYYKEKEEDAWPLEPLISVPNSQTSISFQGESIVGCYGITAVDDATPPNESKMSNIICLDGCPFIELPNVFTPNGSGNNNFFLPVTGDNGELKFRDIEDFKIEIFNRWGGLVYRTESIDEFTTIGWDGTDQNNGSDCSEGVYYYVVLYTAKSTKNIDEQTLSGFVHLFR